MDLKIFKWLIFSNESKISDGDTIPIPYDCEFLFVHPKNVTAYQIIEHTMAKNNSFFYDFGTWDRYTGFIFATHATNDLRRINLNGIQLNIHISYVGFYHFNCEAFISHLS